MRSLEEPDAPRGRGLLWILLGLALVGGALAWYAAHRTTPPPATSATPAIDAGRPEVPTRRNEPPPATERAPAGDSRVAAPSPRPSRGRARDNATDAAGVSAAARELRVTSDIAGAYVFLNRKFLGTTPLTSRDVAPGTYQLNVQIEGRPPVVQTVAILPNGPTDVAVTMPAPANTAAAAAAVDADVAVVHQHGVGSCEGTLRASADGLRYETTHKDAFSVPFASVESLTVDYVEKRLRLKQRSGRTWNFTTRAPNADPLFVFHREVEGARR